ncbi:MAG TPA: lysophospholipid acyltransferase family protein [Pirellulales bacterium]|jgi:1-acyl-sn-glycerol-3-phosphate acyltransferase|nr:lysophospholipid acyltransferase family protein [Pirellulales bacterium]
MAQRSWGKRTWYQFLHVTCRLVGVVAFRVRVSGREWVPKNGGALVLSNHQSHLDPVLIGLAGDRRMNFLARKTLFKFPPFRWLIDSLDAIPIDREKSSFGGLKETLRRLKHDELVLLFPEGTRTADGRIGALKPGFCAIARRAGVPLVPVAIDGAFAAFPRTRNYPLPATIHIAFGEPLQPSEIPQFETDDALVAEVRRRLEDCHEKTRRTRDAATNQRSDRTSETGNFEPDLR